MRFGSYINFLTTVVTCALAAKKNLIVDTDLFSDVDDAGALLLAATLPNINLLAVNINTPSCYSAVAASAILAHYGRADVPIGIKRPLVNATFFDTWRYELGEYASKVAYHWSSGQLPWSHAEEAWDPVTLYRKVLAQAEDRSVTIVSIGFLDNLSALLNSTADAHSSLDGRSLVTQKVSELVAMGGGYPGPRHSYNFWGSGPYVAAHVLNNWEGPITFVGDDVGKHVKAGKPLIAEGPGSDPVRMAYIYYGYGRPLSSWDPLTILYAADGLGKLFKFGNEFGHNHVEANGSNRWIYDEKRTSQHFLRLKESNKTAATKLDRLFLNAARKYAKESQPEPNAPRPDHNEFPGVAKFVFGVLCLASILWIVHRLLGKANGASMRKPTTDR